MAPRTRTVDPDELMTLEEVAQHLKVSVRTLHRYLAKGGIPKVTLPSGNPRIRRGDLMKFLASTP